MTTMRMFQVISLKRKQIMNQILNHLLKASLLTVAAVLLSSCSRGNDKASNIDPRTGKHPAGWAVADTGGAHPAAFFTGPSACYECHGKDLSGGISKVSCFSASRSGISCHVGGPSGHPVGWAAPDAHGAAAKAHLEGQNGLVRCQLCHGADFSGGIAKISCLNTTGCHGAGIMAAHSPKPWLSRIGGRTHSSSDPSNAAACAVCHTSGANSSRTPTTTAPAGTALGCYNNTLCHGVEGHAFADWTDANFHGAAAKAAEGGTTFNGLNNPVSSFGNCAQCHGASYDGGTAQQSCLNTAGCHGANVSAPHPARPWRSATGVTHTTTDTGNAGQCAVCHTNGANSTRTPRAGDATGSSGCFNNTLCHGAEGHAAGWNAAAQHGAAAKSAPGAATGFSSCQLCHGSTFNNGSAPSCMNTFGCHGLLVSSPHPARPWTSTAVGASTHTTTDSANAATCAICHTGGANSSVVPPTPPGPASGPAGCYNNTLCHFHTIPFKPPGVDPAVHGGLAKQDLSVCQNCHGVKGTTAFDGLAVGGGATTIACSSCHAFAKAHPTAWQGSTTNPGETVIYSHRTAGGIASGCSLCHDVNQGRNAPLVAAPSCFSSTFTNGISQTGTCHANGPGAAPHSVPYPNHNATARSNFNYCLGCHQVAANDAGSKPPGCQNCHLTSPVATPTGCSSCHTNPPAGVSYPNIASVHAQHVSAGKVTVMALACADCHTGLGLGTLDHLNRARARTVTGRINPVVFSSGPLLVAGGGSPSAYSDATGQCANVYCHGAKMPGGDITGTNSSPAWNAPFLPATVSAAACGTCHGFPPSPASGHPAVSIPAGFPATATIGSTCSCHDNISTTGNSYANIFINPSLHIDGTLQVSTTAAAHIVPYLSHYAAARSNFNFCLGCHQVAANAPGSKPPGCLNCHLTSPVATPSGCSSCHANPPNGASYPNIVNAHVQHVNASKVTVMNLSCADCHTGLGLGTLDHLNRARARSVTGRANPVAFSGGTLLVAGGGLVSAYTDSSGQCANVYCHGAKMPGGDVTGTNRTPAWGAPFLPVTVSAAACGMCHGFPPSPASGHPVVTIPTGFPSTATIGSTCSCHANINTTGNSYANIFVNPALHIDGTLQVSAAAVHSVPYDTHKVDVVAAGGNTACLGCHALGSAASPYPAAVAGNPPDCMSCHQKAAPLHTGTGAGANCSSCHGLSTATTTKIGRPVGPAYPDRVGFHDGSQDSLHGSSACIVCHNGAGTTSGNNSGINHGKGSTAGPVRNGKPNVVGPMVNGITPTTSAKGVGTPANSTTCVHGTINSSCSGGGTKTNRW